MHSYPKAKLPNAVHTIAIVLMAVLLWPNVALSADPTKPVTPTWPPEGTAVRVPITRDTWVATLGNEKYGNNGGESRMKLKGQQEYAIFDIDADALKGKIIAGVLWHFKCASLDAQMKRLSVSSLAVPFVEGTSTGYKPQEGSSCFAQAQYGKQDWTYSAAQSADAGRTDVRGGVARRFQANSTFMDACFGRSHTIWRFADATPPNADGWQSVAVSADVVAARVAGLSHGFAVCDDVGSEWQYVDGKFDYLYFPNRFIVSHEQSNAAPYLEVWTSGTDTTPPAGITEMAVDTASFPAGEALVTWKTPADTGGGKTLGFNVTYKSASGSGEMPRYLIPMAGEPGDEVRMHIQDMPLAAGEKVELTIAAVDSAGNVGSPGIITLKVSANPPAFNITPTALKPFAPSETLPTVGTVKVAVVDLIDKISPTTGAMVPAHKDGYKGGNHLWSAADKRVRLQSARNEAVCFQVNLEGQAPNARMTLAFDDKAIKPTIYRFDYHTTGNGVMPDAMVEQTGPFRVPFDGDPQLKDAKNVSLVCEIYVPHNVAPGTKKGTLTIATGGQSIELNVDLTVWDFTLPNKLSFVPEMNAYATAGPTGRALDYYRIAHENRLCINRLYYGWEGAATGPEWNGKTFKWATWAKDFGPLFTGDAFKDLPRAGEPVDVFYLPFNENWPVDVFKHFKASYWADEAFTSEYVDQLSSAFAAFAKFCDRQKWHDTIFEFYLNNKVYYKQQPNVGWTGSSAPWIFDEPVNIQDFWALRWYGLLWHQAVGPVKGNAKMWYRGDVSYSHYGRNSLWGVMDLECFGGSNEQKVRMKHDEQTLWGQAYFTEYGAANRPKDANIQPLVWCLTAWSRGAVGVLPWRTINAPANCWDKADQTNLFYLNKAGLHPSVRLKSFRRGQQDVEYLTLLGDVYDAPQYAVAAGMKQMVDLTGKVHKTHETDAGTIQFDKADSIALWRLRTSVGQMVSAKKPPYQRCLRPMPNPETGITNLPDIGYVPVAPNVEAAKPTIK